MADEFGEEIPCSGYAEIGGEEIGHEVCKYADSTGIVLLRNHGVFTIPVKQWNPLLKKL